jgi:prepilin-type N-terminal cleavage/methylation domain-containing protein
MSFARADQRRLPRGFTLVEMLVAITIFAILATIAITSFSETGSDRVPAAARQLRAMMGGAQSRAAKDKAPRGLRLFIDPDASATFATSIAYVGSNVDIEGELADQNLAATALAPARTVKLTPNGIGWMIQQGSGETVSWTDLETDGNVRVGDRIYLQWTTNTAIESTERKFVITTITTAMGVTQFRITGPDPPPSLVGNIRYRLELAPEILPNNQPVSLPRGTVIDLDASKFPASMRAGVAAAGYLDIMFSARGEVSGRVASEGIIHFYVGQLEDSLADREDPTMSNEMPIRIINGPPMATPVYPQRVVSLVPATGQVLTAEYASTAPDPFLLATEWQEAK